MEKERYDRNLIYNYVQRFLESISLNDENTIKELINLELFKKASEMKNLRFAPLVYACQLSNRLNIIELLLNAGVNIKN